MASGESDCVYPILQRIRPQFASLPYNAVFTSGERAMVDATRCASRYVGAEVTVICTNFVAPSPSRTTSCARRWEKEVRTSCIAA